jgi:hypothetical protein
MAAIGVALWRYVMRYAPHTPGFFCWQRSAINNRKVFNTKSWSLDSLWTRGIAELWTPILSITTYNISMSFPSSFGHLDILYCSSLYGFYNVGRSSPKGRPPPPRVGNSIHTKIGNLSHNLLDQVPSKLWLKLPILVWMELPTRGGGGRPFGEDRPIRKCLIFPNRAIFPKGSTPTSASWQLHPHQNR